MAATETLTSPDAKPDARFRVRFTEAPGFLGFLPRFLANTLSPFLGQTHGYVAGPDGQPFTYEEAQRVIRTLPGATPGITDIEIVPDTSSPPSHAPQQVQP